MELVTVKWADKEQTTLLINGNMSMPWPTSTWHAEYVQAWLDAGNVPAPWRSVEEHRSAKLEEARTEAHIRITTMAPEWKQRNALAARLELTDKKAAGTPLTGPEQLIEDEARALWQYVKDVRAASDIIEAEVLVAADPENYDVAGSPHWPS